MTAKIFWSYARPDKDFAHHLADVMAREGVDSFLPDRDVPAGANWQQRILDELRDADLIIPVLSPEALRSNLFLMELGAAWSLNKPMIPIMRDNEVDVTTMPVSIDRLHVLRADHLSDDAIATRVRERLAA